MEVFDYAALGHIHKPMKVGNEYYRYCGTPLACSVSEAGQNKGIVLAELGEKGAIKVSELPLTPLRQVKVLSGTAEEILRQSCHDYVTVVLTDKTDLDIIDIQDRIRSAFPNLLEIRRQRERDLAYDTEISLEEEMNPFELCNAFLKDLTEEEKEMIRDLINNVKGA